MENEEITPFFIYDGVRYDARCWRMGHSFTCPNCRLIFVLRQPCVLLDNAGAVTVIPSVECPHNCGWHVWITDGHATDVE